MEYINIDGLEKPISRIIMGGSSSPMWKGEHCDGLLNAAYAMGITCFDTARGYGKSEEVFADWVDRTGLRDKVVIQTKGALHGLLGNNRVKEKCIRKDFAMSLQKLKTDCIDIYILHRDDPKTDVGWIVELMNEFKVAGKLKAWGGSNWTYERIQAANEYAYKHDMAPMSVSEPHFSLAEAGRWTWIGCTSITGEKQAAEREWYKKTQMPLMAFSPLGGGFFSGRVKSDDFKNTKKCLSHAMQVTFASEANRERLRRAEELSKELGCTVSQIAHAWILQSGMNTCTIIGNSRVESMMTSIGALEIKLTPEQKKYINLE